MYINYKNHLQNGLIYLPNYLRLFWRVSVYVKNKYASLISEITEQL